VYTRPASALLDPAAFDGEVDGQRVGLHQIRSPGGMAASVCSYGARVMQLLVPEAHGGPVDVVVGLPSLQALKCDGAWMGAFVGRFANRIGRAQLRRGDRHWPLRANEGVNNLHSGTQGCAHQVFDVVDHRDDKLVLGCTLPHGADGFPGEIALRLTYALDDSCGLTVAWHAQVHQAATVCSFTSHIYFNLSGQGGLAPVTDHRLQIAADHVLALDQHQVPTGQQLGVAGGPLDWRTARTVGSTAFDHYWVTAAAPGPLACQALLTLPGSSRALAVWSTEPGLQFYAGGSLGGHANGQCDQHGRLIVPGAGLCLEPSGYPDAPSHPQFPDPWVEPGGTREGRIEYRLK